MWLVLLSGESSNVRFLVKSSSLRHSDFSLTFFVLIPQIFPSLKNCGLPQFFEGKICYKINKKSSESFNYYTNISIFLMCFCIITFFIFLYKICQIRKKSPPRRFGRPKPRKARFCATRHPVGGIPRLAERHGDFFLQKSTGV